jgi:hypothetical protein
LVISGFSTGIVGGVPQPFTVSAVDAYGNITPNYAGTVHFSSNDLHVRLPADYTFNPLTDQGTHSFIVTFLRSGQKSLTVSDAADGFTFTTPAIQILAALSPTGVWFVPYQNLAFTTTVALFTSTNPNAQASQFQAVVDWGDGSATDSNTLITAVGNGVFIVTASHMYTVETTFLVDVTVTDTTTGANEVTAPSAAVVLTGLEGGQVKNADFVRSTVGQTALSVSVADVTATLENTPNGGQTTAFVAQYGSDPEAVAFNAADFFDVRVTGVDAETELKVTFTYDAKTGVNGVLNFFDSHLDKFVKVRDGDLTPNNFVIDTLHHTITVVFSKTSNPTITELNGTVFSVAVDNPNSQTQTTVSPGLALSSLSGNSPGSLGGFKAASFQNTSQVNFLLSSSQDSRTGDSGEGATAAGDNQPDKAAVWNSADEYTSWLRMMEKVLENDPVMLWRLTGDDGLKLWLLDKAPPLKVPKPAGAAEEPQQMDPEQARDDDLPMPETNIDQVFADYAPIPVNRVFPAAGSVVSDDSDWQVFSSLASNVASEPKTTQRITSRVNWLWAAPLAGLAFTAQRWQADEAHSMLRAKPRLRRITAQSEDE